MEKENNKAEGGCAMCNMMNGMQGHKHWMHLIIKIAIVVFIFWAGVQFGELKGMLHGNYGSYGDYGRARMMGGFFGGEVNRAYGPSMMYGWTQGSIAQPSVTIIATTTKK